MRPTVILAAALLCVLSPISYAVEAAAVEVANLGITHLLADEFTQALSAFQEAALLCPHDAEFFVLIFRSLGMLTIKDETIALAESLLARSLICAHTFPSVVAPNLLAAAHRSIGLIHASHGQFNDALALFATASDFHSCHFNTNYLAAARDITCTLGVDYDRHATLAALAPFWAMEPPRYARIGTACAALRACARAPKACTENPTQHQTIGTENEGLLPPNDAPSAELRAVGVGPKEDNEVALWEDLYSDAPCYGAAALLSFSSVPDCRALVGVSRSHLCYCGKGNPF